MTSRWLYLISSPLALALLAGVAAAQWSPGGVRLCQSGCPGDIPIVVADGQGGAFVAWRDSRDYPLTDGDVYLQRVTASGQIALGWPPEGLPVCTALRYQAPTSLAADGHGGVLIAWPDFRHSGTTFIDTYAQRVLGDGTLAPGWPVNGVAVCQAPYDQDYEAICPDGAGGAYVGWEDWRNLFTQSADIYGQHLSASAKPSAGWAADGLPVCTDIAAQAGPVGVVPDGSGGVALTWTDTRSGHDIYAQHLLADGSIAPGWAPNGVLVLPAVPLRKTVPDGAGGFYVAGSTTDGTGFELEYWVQHFTFAGTRFPGWPDAGVRACGAPGERGGFTYMGPDGLGGVLLTWWDYRPPYTGGEIFAVRLLSDGSLAPGWTTDGTRVSDASAPGFEFDPDIAPDGQGGAYLVWQRQDSFGNPGLVQHLNARGAVAPGWPPYGLRLTPSRSQADCRITSDGHGGAIVVWDEGGLVVYAQRFVMDGVVAVEVSLVSAAAEPERVTLVWHAANGASFHATVERRGERTDWLPLAAVIADGTGRTEYEDRAVAAGRRYAYRLAYVEGGAERRTTETLVEVPVALTLALEGAQPNPVVGPLTVAFTLPRVAPARLELLDVSGRQVLAREVGDLGAGRHLLRLGEHGCTPPGMYWLRLTQSGGSLVKRAVIVR